jgi:hypothetical protein
MNLLGRHDLAIARTKRRCGKSGYAVIRKTTKDYFVT